MHERGFSSGLSGCGRGEFFGAGLEGMSRASRVGVGSAVISLVVASGLLLAVFAPGAWWVVTIYGWVIFPALGLVSGGIPGGASRSVSGRRGIVEPESGERRLLEAMARSGGITPARAALETSLSVSEAEEILSGLASGGYVEVRVQDGGIFYSMWEGDER